MNVDYLESSVLGTVLIYPHLQKRMIDTLGKYKFSLNVRNLAYEGIKRLQGKNIEKKPTLFDWLNSINKDDMFEKLLSNVFHREVFAVSQTLKFKDFQKYKCKKEELEAYLITCMHQKGVYDIIRFNWILKFLLELKIKEALAEGYYELLSSTNKEDIGKILKNNENLVVNMKNWIKEINKRTNGNKN